MKPPTPQPRLKRLSHGPSQNETTENDEGFVMVAKKKLKKQKKQRSCRSAQQRAGDGAEPRACAGGEPAASGRGVCPSCHGGRGERHGDRLTTGAVQRSSLSEPQQAEAEAAVTTVAVLGGGEESGAVEVERAAEELAAVDGGADSEDGAEEMEGELSDSSLISDIPDSQPVNRGKKLYTLDEF
ncbi:UNVERIFIED_CONTAM: hypothetical protein FKN15_039625 [Acipenser sinensis]